MQLLLRTTQFLRTVGELGSFFGVMGATKDAKRGSTRSSKKQRVKKQAKPTNKSTTRPSDVYEAEVNEPQEEVKAGQRYDVRDPLSSLLASQTLLTSALSHCSVWTTMSTSFLQTLRTRR